MSWKVRHEGSPQSIDGLSLAQVGEGLREGQWEPTDEVMGPGENAWTAIENHPQLADLAADIEPPRPPAHDDETRLDMNPLIDVALVLLVFFVLTTTYETIRKVIDTPSIQKDEKQAIPKITKADLPRFIQVKAYREKDDPVIEVEGRRVSGEELQSMLTRLVDPGKREQVLLDAQGVSWGTLVLIQDAATGAGIKKVVFLQRRTK